MKKALKAVGSVLSCLLVGVLVALTALIWRPEWFLTPSLMAKAVKTLGASYRPQWKAFEPRLVSRSFASKEFRLHAEDFCFNGSSGTLKGCFDRVDAAISVTLTPRGVYLTRIARMDVAGRYLSLDFAHAPPSPKERKRRRKDGYRGLPGLLPSSLARLRIDSMNLLLPRNTFVLKSTATITGELSLTYSASQTRPLELKSRLRYRTPLKRENINATLSIGSDLFTKGSLSYLDALGRLKGDAGDDASLEARIEQKAENETGLTARASLRNGARRLTARLSGTQTPTRYRGRLNARVMNPAAALRTLSIDSCEADVPLDGKARPQGLTLGCLLSAEPTPFGARPGSRAKKIDARINLVAQLKPRGIQRDYFEGTLDAAVEPRKDWYDFGASLKAELAGRLGALPSSLRSKHSLDASLKIARFEDLVAYLKGTASAVPAPLHVLRGPLEITVNSSGDTRGPDHEFVYRLRSDLTSGRQKLKAAVDGTLLAEQAFTADRRLKAGAKISLEEVAFELPYLTVGGLPPVTMDSRIVTGDPKIDKRQEAARAGSKMASAPALDYTVRILTGKPILLYSNINPAPIPLAIDLLARPTGFSGRVVVQRFDAELFKKKGSVDHVTLAMSPGSRAMELDGLIRFKQDDTDILVKLLGSTEKPRVIFESEPPMDQQAIIALLLFNKAPDDLDPDQSASVSNSQSAMANGAFGLASLYLFASTPIQHVGYDPATQTYAIKFSLPGGASLEVGSGADQSRHLTLRKRLARRWVLQTEVRRNQDDERNAVTTFLEWFQRY